MNQHEQRELKQDILDELENWWMKVEGKWFPGWRKQTCNVSVPGLPSHIRRPRFEVRISYPGNFVPEYFCPYPELSVYDRKYSWGYTKVLQKEFVEICTDCELYFNRIAEDIYHIFEEEDQKRIKELLNKQYGLFEFGSSKIGIGKYTAEIFAQELDKIDKNKRSYHGDSVDSYRYALEVMGQRKLTEYNISEMYPKYMFRQDNLFSDGITTRKEIYRQTKNYFDKMKEKVLDSCGVPATVVMPRNVGYSNAQRQMELYGGLLFENDSITKNKFKEDLDNMGRNYRMPRQCAIIFDNGENLLLDVESVKREEMYCSISPKFELEGRYKYPATAGESDLPMRVLGEWRAALKPELSYEKVILNDPATIVIWKDGTKTVVRCQEGDEFDPEKGIALCFMKKALGNKGNFNDILKQETEKYRIKEQINIGSQVSEGLMAGMMSVGEAMDKLRTGINNIMKKERGFKNFYQIKFLKKNKLHINKFEDNGNNIKEVEQYNIPDPEELLYHLIRNNFYSRGRIVDRKRSFGIRFEENYVINVDGHRVILPGEPYHVVKRMIENPKNTTVREKIETEAANEQNEDS